MPRKPLPRLKRHAVFSRDSYRCKRCGFFGHDGAGLHVHHVIEVCQGGSDDPENLHTLCGDCHDEWTWTWCVLAYDEWLTTIPARWLSWIFTLTWPSDVSASEFKAWLAAKVWTIASEHQQRQMDQIQAPPPSASKRKHAEVA